MELETIEEEQVEEVEEIPEPEEEKTEIHDVSEQIDEAVERSQVERCKTKRDYICQIKKLTDAYSDRELVRTKKGDLKIILADEFEKSIEKVSNHPDVQVEPDRNKNLVVNTMYRLTLGCCTLIEGVSKNYSGYLNGYCLHQYAQTIDGNAAWRATMLDVLAEIYQENSQMLTAMMTKEGRLGFVLVMAGAQSMRNYDTLTNGNKGRHCNSVEQNPVHYRGPKPGKVEPSPSAYFDARRRKKSGSGDGERRSDPLWERGFIPAVAVAKTPTQVLPGTENGSDRGVFSDQFPEVTSK